MASNLRSTTNEDRLSALEVDTHTINHQLEKMNEEIATIKNGLEALTNAVAQIGKDLEAIGGRGKESSSVRLEEDRGNKSVNQTRGNSQGGGVQTRFSRLEFPCFNGENLTGWIYKVEQFFRYQGTAPNEKVVLASFHLQDDALEWYQWYEQTQPNVTWEELTQALCVRFGPSDYEDFDEALAKLRQTGTIREYQTQFERLAARVRNWPEKALLGSYIGGLKEEIQSDVKLFHPTTLLHATSLARLQ